MKIDLICGDSKVELQKLDDDSVDSLITDPPAGISFMGKEWDKDKGGRDKWIEWLSEIMKECHRVMKPGAHGLVWALPRTSHWTATTLEDAGFEIRDILHHLFATGFPKSHNVAKAIDKMNGKKGKVVRNRKSKQWQGWGSALKPASEHWILIRKPINQSIAKNVLEHGTGAINIDGCRIKTIGGSPAVHRRSTSTAPVNPGSYENEKVGRMTNRMTPERYREERPGEAIGRWPANLVLSHHPECVEVGVKTVKKEIRTGDYKPEASGRTYEGRRKFGTGFDGGSKSLGNIDETIPVFDCHPECPVKMLDEQSGNRPGCSSPSDAKPNSIFRPGQENYMSQGPIYRDDGGASRFFYVAKPSSNEKDIGLEGEINHHPTVKSIELMRHFAKLITPPDGIILDTFMGSGSTGCAAVIEGFSFIGIEIEKESYEIASKRINYVKSHPPGEIKELKQAVKVNNKANEFFE